MPSFTDPIDAVNFLIDDFQKRMQRLEGEVLAQRIACSMLSDLINDETKIKFLGMALEKIEEFRTSREPPLAEDDRFVNGAKECLQSIFTVVKTPTAPAFSIVKGGKEDDER